MKYVFILIAAFAELWAIYEVWDSIKTKISPKLITKGKSKQRVYLITTLLTFPVFVFILLALSTFTTIIRRSI